MKFLTSIIICLLAFSCQTSNVNDLESDILELELSYIAWACDCPNWARVEDLDNYSDDDLANRCIYIEAAFDSLKLPDTIGFNNDLIKFKGQFFSQRKYPMDFQSIQSAPKAKVFRYTDYEVIRSNYESSKVGIKSEQ